MGLAVTGKLALLSFLHHWPRSILTPHRCKIWQLV